MRAAIPHSYGRSSRLGIPLLREGTPIGVLTLTRSTARPFTGQQMELAATFADQAVIAIENVRLFEAEQARTRELSESLEQQTATSEVLRVISTSPTDTQPVFDAILESATELCAAETGILFRYAEGAYHALATRLHDAHLAETFKQSRRPAPDSQTGLGRLMRERRTVHIPDMLNDPAYDARDPLRFQVLQGGMRSWLGVPMLKEGELIGAIVIYRSEQRAFTEQQIALLQTFADQAVIAIENGGLFDEVQARTREVQESLDYQTAISDVLNVISRSPNELQPVFDSIVQTSTRLCEAEYSVFFRRQDDGNYRIAATDNAEAEFIKFAREYPFEPTRASCTGRAVLERGTIHILDASTDPEYHMPEFTRITKHRTLLGVPLARDDIVIGVIVLARTIVQPFTEKQIELVTTFASQALIAIENVRLFEAEQARSRELQESLQQQTATADVLKVISRLGVRAAACSRHLGRHCCAPVQCRNGVYFPSPRRGLSISGQLRISPCLRGISEGRGTISKSHHRYGTSRARRSSGPCGRYTRRSRI